MYIGFVSSSQCDVTFAVWVCLTRYVQSKLPLYNLTVAKICNHDGILLKSPLNKEQIITNKSLRYHRQLA